MKLVEELCLKQTNLTSAIWDAFHLKSDTIEFGQFLIVSACRMAYNCTKTITPALVHLYLDIKCMWTVAEKFRAAFAEHSGNSSGKVSATTTISDFAGSGEENDISFAILRP